MTAPKNRLLRMVSESLAVTQASFQVSGLATSAAATSRPSPMRPTTVDALRDYERYVAALVDAEFARARLKRQTLVLAQHFVQLNGASPLQLPVGTKWSGAVVEQLRTDNPFD